MPEPRPVAFYAGRAGGLGDWWTLLHPPYTLWHLSYVVIGACIAPAVSPYRLGMTLGAFFLAVGVAAHALDELNGRPLRTSIPAGALWAAAVTGLVGALALGVIGIGWVGPGLVTFMAAGAGLVAAYNLEWFGGRLHTDVVFAVGWGAFPVLTAYFAQAGRLGATALLGGAFAFFLSAAQRALSTPARKLRRRALRVEGVVELHDGTLETLGALSLLAPLERALRAISWAVATLAAALALYRLG